MKGPSKAKKLTPDEALLVTRYRLGWFRIVKDSQGWRVEMNSKLKEAGHDI